jgi:hypothetical protein
VKIAWIATAVALPKPGQTVHARIKSGTVVHRVTFFDTPTLQWEEPGFVFPFEYFADWAPIADDKPQAQGSGATAR